MDEQRKNSLTAEADGVIEGRNAVIEALRAGETIDKIYILKGETDKTLGHIASKARAAGKRLFIFPLAPRGTQGETAPTPARNACPPERRPRRQLLFSDFLFPDET